MDKRVATERIKSSLKIGGSITLVCFVVCLTSAYFAGVAGIGILGAILAAIALGGLVATFIAAAGTVASMSEILKEYNESI